jgi:hypothetical protein
MMEVSVTKILTPPGVPAGQRSPLWGYEDEIRRLLGEGWSYRQIAAALEKVGVSVTVGWLQKWGRANLGPVRRPAKKTGSVPAAQATPAPESGASAPPAGEGKGSPSPASGPAESKVPGAPAGSISQVLDDERRERTALADQFFRPKK